MAHIGEVVASRAASAGDQGTNSLDVEALYGSISRPLADGSGNYTVIVAMHPPELGHLQAVVSLNGNDLQVALTAQTHAGHEALANASDALKNQLARGGVNVNVTLRDPGSQSSGEERGWPSTSGTPSFVVESTPTEALLQPGVGSGQIHLVL
jgi:flagellar hook-length control protein FliK